MQGASREPAGVGEQSLEGFRNVGLTTILGPRLSFVALIQRQTSALPCTSLLQSLLLGLLRGQDHQEPGLAPDSRSWSVFWPSWHLPFRAAGAVPIRCQVCSGPALVDLISSTLSHHTFTHPGPWTLPCLLLSGPVCLRVAHGLEWGVEMAY